MTDGKRILIIDDEEDIITYLATFFEDNGFNVITAPNGKEGVQKAISESM